jgi:hypothetical protein
VTFAFVVAVIIGAAILAGTIWSIRFIASGPPPEPDIEDVMEVDVPYLCTVCGMSLTITQAHEGDIEPPRHCREPMLPA